MNKFTLPRYLLISISAWSQIQTVPPGLKSHLLLVSSIYVNRITLHNGVTDWGIFSMVISQQISCSSFLGNSLYFLEENNRISTQEMWYTNTLQIMIETHLWFAGAAALELLLATS
jgi:hypothetical protein